MSPGGATTLTTHSSRAAMSPRGPRALRVPGAASTSTRSCEVRWRSAGEVRGRPRGGTSSPALIPLRGRSARSHAERELAAAQRLGGCGIPRWDEGWAAKGSRPCPRLLRDVDASASARFRAFRADAADERRRGVGVPGPGDHITCALSGSAEMGLAASYRRHRRGGRRAGPRWGRWRTLSRDHRSPGRSPSR